MPKDSVFGPGRGVSKEPEPFLQVGWNRGRSLSVGVLAGGDSDEPLDNRPQMWVDLERDGVNRLIRMLRKARDQAFGSDA